MFRGSKKTSRIGFKKSTWLGRSCLFFLLLSLFYILRIIMNYHWFYNHSTIFYYLSTSFLLINKNTCVFFLQKKRYILQFPSTDEDKHPRIDDSEPLEATKSMMYGIFTYPKCSECMDLPTWFRWRNGHMNKGEMAWKKKTTWSIWALLTTPEKIIKD